MARALEVDGGAGAVGEDESEGMEGVDKEVGKVEEVEVEKVEKVEEEAEESAGEWQQPAITCVQYLSTLGACAAA